MSSLITVIFLVGHALFGPVESPDASVGTGTIDYPAFVACFAGPNTAIAAGCERMNMRPDMRIDLRDVAVLQRSYSLTPGLIRGASETAGVISPLDEIDEYTFPGTFGTTVTVDFSTPTVNGRPDLVVRFDLVRPNGSVHSTTASCGTTVRMDSVALDVSGTWRVRVKQYESWSNCGFGADMELRTGNYSLTVCPSDAPTRPFAYGQTHKSGFTADCQIINYQFSGALDDQASAMYIGESSLRNMRLRAPNGIVLGTSGGGMGAVLNDVLLPLAGMYNLAVEAADGQTPGTFGLGLSEIGAAVPIAANGPTNGSLVRAAEADTYTFLGTFGTTVTVDYSTPSVSGRPDVVARIDLVRPNGTVAATTATCSTTIRLDTIPLDATGTWTVRVRAFESWFNCGFGADSSLITGSYVLTVCPSNQPSVSIAYGETKDGSFAADCQIVNYQFTGAVGDVASLVYLGPANTRRVQLFLPTGGLLATSGGGQGTSLTDILLPLNGVYRIAVEAADGQPTGNFSIGLSKLGSAVPITINAVTAGMLSAPAEVDTYSFSGVYGSTVTVDFSTPSVSARPDVVVRVDLLRPNGTTAATTATCGTTIRLDTIPLDATGTWTVRVRAYESWFNCGFGPLVELITGSYSLTVCPSNATPVDIAYGQTRNGSFAVDCQIVNYQFVGALGDQVTLVYIGPANLRRMQLYAPNGTLLGTSGGGLGASLSDVLLPLDGLYRIAVEAADNLATGNFSIGLAELGGAVPVAFDTVIDGAFSFVAEVDAYAFAGSFGSTITVDYATPTISNQPDVVVRLDLVRPSGTVAATTATCGGTARLDNVLLDMTGQWTVRVRIYESWFNCGFGPDVALTTGVYSLTLCPSTGAPTSIAYNQQRNGMLSVDCQIRNYDFSGTAGDVASVLYYGPAYVRHLMVYASNGSLLATSGAGLGAAVTDLILPLTGMYRIEVEGADNQALGAFSIGLSRLAGATALTTNMDTPGMIGQTGEADVYSFSGTSGSVISVKATTAVISNKPDIALRIDLIRPDGTQHSSTPTCGGVAQVNNVTLDATGTWRVRVRAYESWSNCGFGADTTLLTGSYSLRVCTAASCP